MKERKQEGSTGQTEEQKINIEEKDIKGKREEGPGGKNKRN